MAAAAAAEEPDANETNGESASRDESNQGRRGLGEGGNWCMYEEFWVLKVKFIRKHFNIIY